MAYQVNFCETKEQLKHLGEVVTGKTDGSPTGADIETSTLEYTGQARETLPALLAKLGWYSVGEWSTDPLISNDNQYVLYNGIRYVPLSTPYQVNSTLNPNPELLVGTELKVITDVTDEDITTAQNDIVGGSIFKGSNGEYVQNGDTVPTGTTHLRVLVGGEPDIVAILPISSGNVSSLTDSSATIGGVDVIFESWLIDGIDNSPLKVRVDQNEQDAFRNLDECKKMLSRIHLGRGGNIWNFGRIINILGDSISHGAYAGDLYFNGWTQILRRMANIEFGSASWGFVSIKDSETSGGDFFQEVHSVVRNGAWIEKFRADASYIINGFGLRSSTATDNLQITVPTFTDKFVVWWSKLPTGGSFEIYVNGALKATQPTFGGTNEGWFLSTSVAMEDNGKGSCNIEIRVVGDGDVEILGMSYFNSTSDLMVNNFSQFGRRLSEVDEQTIITAIEGATDFVLALGYNDAGPANSDPLIAAAFTQRIDWIIQYCNQFNVNAIILDFNWARPESWHVRQELERCANSINSAKFVSFPRYLSIDNQPQSPTGYLQPIGFLVDDAHPTALGHGMIAETVSKALSLSVNSKEQANRHDTMWIPFQISNVNDLENRYPSQPKAISAWRFNGGCVEMKWHVQRAATAPFIAGSYRLVDSTDFNIAQGQFVETKFQAVSTASDGDLVVSTQRMDARQFGGEINIVIDPKNSSLYSEWFGVLPLTPYR